MSIEEEQLNYLFEISVIFSGKPDKDQRDVIAPEKWVLETKDQVSYILEKYGYESYVTSMGIDDTYTPHCIRDRASFFRVDLVIPENIYWKKFKKNKEPLIVDLENFRAQLYYSGRSKPKYFNND